MQAVLTEVKSTLSLLIACLLFVSWSVTVRLTQGGCIPIHGMHPFIIHLDSLSFYSADILIHFFGLIAFALPALFLHRAINGFRNQSATNPATYCWPDDYQPKPHGPCLTLY